MCDQSAGCWSACQIRLVCSFRSQLKKQHTTRHAPATQPAFPSTGSWLGLLGPPVEVKHSCIIIIKQQPSSDHKTHDMALQLIPSLILEHASKAHSKGLSLFKSDRSIKQDQTTSSLPDSPVDLCWAGPAPLSTVAHALPTVVTLPLQAHKHRTKQMRLKCKCVTNLL